MAFRKNEMINATRRFSNSKSGCISKHGFKMHKENIDRTKIEANQNHIPVPKVNTTSRQKNQ